MTDWEDELVNRVIEGDALATLRELPDSSIDVVVTSPPYWTLRDYEVDGQLGLEENPRDYIQALVAIAEELQRVVTEDGAWYLNLGDTYNTNSIVRSDSSGLQMQKGDDGYEEFHTKEGREKNGRMRRSVVDMAPKKSKLFIPARAAIAIAETGWVARNEIKWCKPTASQDNATDRYRTTHESFFYFTQSGDSGLDAPSPQYDHVRESTASSEHAAAYPPRLVQPFIEHSCPEDGVVLDPFAGSGTTLVAAKRRDRDYLGIELKPEYVAAARKRLKSTESSTLTRWTEA